MVDKLPELDIEYVFDSKSVGTWPVALKADSYEEIEDGCKGPKVSFFDLVELYEFADRRDAKALSDHVVSVMLEKISVERVLPVEAIAHLLTKTIAGKHSPMFQMLVEIALQFIDHRDLEKYVDGIPKEFVIALVGRQREDGMSGLHGDKDGMAKSGCSMVHGHGLLSPRGNDGPTRCALPPPNILQYPLQAQPVSFHPPPPVAQLPPGTARAQPVRTLPPPGPVRTQPGPIQAHPPIGPASHLRVSAAHPLTLPGSLRPTRATGPRVNTPSNHPAHPIPMTPTQQANAYYRMHMHNAQVALAHLGRPMPHGRLVWVPHSPMGGPVLPPLLFVRACKWHVHEAGER